MNKNKFIVQTQKNGFTDKGEGVIMFSGKGLTITDNSEQWNGTHYDIPSMNIDQFGERLTANHSDDIQDVIGKVLGTQKIGNRVVIQGIQFAIKENALALYAYNMMKSGYLTDFSIETLGPWPNEEGVYMNSNLVGLSLVVVGNNKKARVNEMEMQQLALNTIEQAKKDGLDTTYIAEKLCYNNVDGKDGTINNSKKIDNMFITIKNSRDFAVVIKYKNASGEDMERELKAGDSIDVSEDQKNAIEEQIKNAAAPQKDIEAVVKNKVQEAMSPLIEEIKAMRKEMFDKGAQEPGFSAANATIANKVDVKLNAMAWQQRHAKQIELAWDLLKNNNQTAGKELSDINKFHVQELQKAGKVLNTVTMADFGNFVISPELLTEIEGHRSDFSALLSKVVFKDTLSLQMAWLKRSGDINMQEVEFCDDGNNGNLKPITEYDATFKTSNLKEVAGVTPVCDAATRFLAVDLLGDIAAGYRTDFDRKRAQIVVARLQQAVNETGYKKYFNGTSDLTALKSWFPLMGQLQENIMSGVYMFNTKTYIEMLNRQLGAGIAVESGFGIFTKGENGSLFLGKPFIIVPNELMPTINTVETKTFVIEGTNVTIDQSVFYFDPATVVGRTSGNLKYDLSTEAAYEVNGVVKSAFQRNELVLRGSFFRGAAVKDAEKVTSMGAAGAS